MQNEKPNQNDFEKMQQQAIRRAKEMQQKSTAQGRQGGSPPPKREGDFPPPDRKRSEERNECKKEKGEEKEKNPLASLLNLDGDMSMLLPLVLLLSKEGTDEIMILALLYIMS